MNNTTIKQFAGELGLGPDKLIEQLKKAGVDKNSENEFLNELDKKKLLDYLKKSHGARDGSKVTLVRNNAHTRNADNRSVVVETRRRKTTSQNQGNKEKMHDFYHKIESHITGLSIGEIGLDTDTDSGRRIKWNKLKSVEISNFKAIDKLEVPLADVTILVGPNGSGKSSILQAIHWAARASSYIAPKNQYEVVSFERLDYLPSSEPLKSAHKKELSSERSTEPTSVIFNHELEDDKPILSATIKIWAARFGSGITVNIEGGAAVSPFKQRKELITAYIPGLAGLSERETLLVQPLLRRQAAGGDAGGVLRNIIFNIASRQSGESNNDAAINRLKDLNNYIQMIHPGFLLEVTFDDREDINIQAFFEDNSLAGNKRPLETAATGILQVIQIFAYLILFKPKILLVDEPDAHLHPDKQERLVEALEQAARDHDVQIILTTHSPHIARAASPAANLLWVNNGNIFTQQENEIRTLLGWGGLDKKILFFVEDEHDHAIRAILRQWPKIYRQISIAKCFGVDNLPGNALLKGLLGSDSFGVKVIIHRDRDFMTDSEVQKWIKRYTENEIKVWVTEKSDTEGYFCKKEYLASVYNVSVEIASKWIVDAISAHSDSKKVFFDKRKLFIKLLYENGGSPASEDLWNCFESNPEDRILGKTLHKSLKVVIKNAGYDEKLINRFYIPMGCELASELKVALEAMLAQ